jgi:monofunctional glycosyltransferase
MGMRRSLRLGVKLVLAVVLGTSLQVFLLRFLNPPATASVAVRYVYHTLTGSPYQVPQSYWRDLRDISPYLRKAVLAGEDQRFMGHRGFDFVELNAAFRDTLFSDRVRGASTISMQAARSLFLWKGRDPLRKGLEAYYTVLMELLWDKKRILEIYLNTVDWGTGIVGAEAASREYFRTRSNRLTPSQAALLAAVLPNPHRWSPAAPTPYLAERQRRILEDMGKMPLI